jgi:hypothetical protein
MVAGWARHENGASPCPGCGCPHPAPPVGFAAHGAGRRRKAAAPGEADPVLVTIILVVALLAVMVAAIAKAAHEAMRRLGLDLMSVLLWLGLAEWPLDPRLQRRN